MASINLKFGGDTVPFEYDDDRFEVLANQSPGEPLSDSEINNKLSNPIGSPQFEDLAKPGESVLIVAPDATRQTGCGQIVNLLVRRLISNGTEPFNISVIFATGIHRKVTTEEKAEILTPFIFQRIKTLDHDPRDLARLVRVGETSCGITVELNRALIEHDHAILVGGINFHYFAGFTGGRKLICPGLASSRTVSATHKLAFDCEAMTRREGVATGKLDGNAVHEAFVEAASFAKPSFAVNTIVDDAGNVVDLTCGDWLESHRAACEKFAEANTITIDEKRDLVIVSCGGSPHDIDLIQAQKALEAASHACNDGGEITLLAECAEGLGRANFLDWFNASDSGELAGLLCEKYQVNGQTAWSLLKEAERFSVRMASNLDAGTLAKMRMTASDILETRSIRGKKTGYIIPAGAKSLISS